MAKKKKSSEKAWILGLGLDKGDGHTRITSGENFRLIGGSEHTHETMTEKAVKMNEQLKRRGKTLDTISHEEFTEIAHEVGMRLVDRNRSRPKKSKD